MLRRCHLPGRSRTRQVRAKQYRRRPTASDTAVQSGMDAARNFTEDPLAKSTPDGPTTLFQEISIHRTPSYGVSGFKVAQEVRYQILSRLELGQRLADGTRKVVQRVEDARLESAEEMSRETYERAPAKPSRAAIHIHLE